MKTKYKHIHFVKDGIINKRDSHDCLNNKTDTYLGYVSYYPTWKKYVFASYDSAVFDESCLKDVIHFMSQL